MATATISDFLMALDDYMASNAQSKTAGPYLATKVSELFDEAEAPLNAKTGPLSKLKEKINALYRKIDAVTVEADLLEVNIHFANRKFMELFKKMSKSVVAFEHLNHFTGKFGAKLVSLTKKSPRSNSDEINRLGNIIGKSINKYITKPVLGPVANSSTKNILSDKATPVNIVRIEPKVLDYVRKYMSLSSDKPNIQNINNGTKNSSTKEKSILGKILGYTVSTIASVGILYFLQKFLYETDLGKSVRSHTKKYLRRVEEWSEKQLKSGNVTFVLTKIMDFVKNITVSIFKNIVNFFDNNHEAVWNTLKDTSIGFIEKMVIPIFGVIKDKIVNIFERQSFDLSKDGVVDTVVKGLKAVGESAFALAIPWFLMRSIPIIGGPFKLLETLAFNPLSAAVMAATASIWNLKNQVDKLKDAEASNTDIAEETAKDSLDRIELAKKTQIKQLSILDDMLKKREATPINERSNGLDIERQKLAVARAKADVAKASEDAAVEERHAENLRKAQAKINSSKITEYANRIASMFGLSYEDQAQELKEHKQKLNKMANDARQTDITIAKKELERKEKLSIQPNKVKTEDAIIVEPHSKDQIIMGKSGGPFDQVMKDMVSRFDVMMGVMAQGLGNVANATIQGSNSVVQAVAATGSSSATPSFGGSDPIRDLRDRAVRSVERY